MNSDQNTITCRYHPQTNTQSYTNFYLSQRHWLCSTSANKKPIATVTVTRHHPLTFSIIPFDRDIFGPNGSCALKASVIQNIIQVCLTSGISLSGSWGSRKRSFWLRTQLGIVQISKLVQTKLKLVMCPTLSLTSQRLFKRTSLKNDRLSALFKPGLDILMMWTLLTLIQS